MATEIVCDPNNQCCSEVLQKPVKVRSSIWMTENIFFGYNKNLSQIQQGSLHYDDKIHFIIVAVVYISTDILNY